MSCVCILTPVVIAAWPAFSAAVVAAANSLGGPIHLLLTDVVMPGAMDGRDLARVAVGRRPMLRTLLTSGFPDARWGGSTARAGSRLLSKPYRKEELRRVVREVLDEGRLGVGPPA